MTDEQKFLDTEEEVDTDPETEETAAENDAEIDRYIQNLMGNAAEEEPEEKKAPEVEHFRVMSQIGEDDHKAVFYHSSLLRHKWTLPAYIIVPAVLAVMFAFDGGVFYSGNLFVALIVLYAAVAGLTVFRCWRWLSKIRRNTPRALHITDTTMIFLTYSIVHLKNEKRTKVEYYHLVDIGETKKRFFMYFDSGKSMVFRKEDMPAETLDAFRAFIETKVHKRTFKQIMR